MLDVSTRLQQNKRLCRLQKRFVKVPRPREQACTSVPAEEGALGVGELLEAGFRTHGRWCQERKIAVMERARAVALALAKTIA